MSDDTSDGFVCRPAPEADREIGMDVYASQAPGTGGRLKDTAADFRVEEIEDVAWEPRDAARDAYPHLVLRATLRQWDTHDFVDRLSSRMGISRRRITWAGTKDKHAVTTQLFAIRNATPDDLPALTDACLDPVGRLGRGLTFGDLVGNRFEIRVRDPTAPERHPEVTAELRLWDDDRVAVPNYFGPQRFGSRRAITHRVGLAILRRDWEAAVMTYLGVHADAEPTETQAFRQFVAETREWEEAVERCPRPLGFERTLLQALVELGDEPDRFRAALDRLPSTLRQLFVHAAQSFVFNRVISERLDDGLGIHRAHPGDVVCFGTDHPTVGPIPDPDRTQRVTPDRVGTVNRHVTSGRAWVTGPLVGTDTDFGGAEPRAIVERVLAEVGVTTEAFDLPEPYASTGTRRPFLVGPRVEVTKDPLTFGFALPSGAYATVVLREYLKASGRTAIRGGETAES